MGSESYNVVKKPWGQYVDLFRASDLVLKVISIDPGQRTSYQTHEKRCETWFVRCGSGIARCNEVDRPMTPGTRITVEIGDRHQMINTGDSVLVVYEMQNGVCDEGDIVRLDDPYADQR